MSSLQVTSDLDRLARGANAAAEVIGPGLQAMVLAIADDALDIARPTAPLFSGKYRNSLHTTSRRTGNGAVATLGTTAVHGPVIEFGRRPGATPPPIGPIAAWLAAKGSDPDLAFVVARSIGRRGIKARPTIRPAVARAWPARDRHVRPLLMRVQAKLAGG